MPIRFRCQDCRSRVKVPEGTQGKQVKCPRCGRIQSVPRHESHQSAVNQTNSLEVHTCVGSIHRAPKRKETLVGAGVSDDRQAFSGGGAPGGSGLDIPTHDVLETEHGKSNGKQMSRKERRRRAALARQAQREREEMAAREEAAKEDQAIAECRKQVEDIFASARNKDFTREDVEPEVEEAVVKTTAAAPVGAPKPITLSGSKRIAKTAEATEPVERPVEKVEKPEPVRMAKMQAPAKQEGWTIDFTNEAYPFLRIIPWVLRITALMLIGPAFKIMLVADASGFSGVVCMLILFAGLSMVVVTWTVGEIANAVRDIALKKAAG